MSTRSAKKKNSTQTAKNGKRSIEEIEDEPLYIVEKILEKKKTTDGIRYKVKWLNYPYSQCTWEPPMNLEPVKDMVAAFDKKQAKQEEEDNEEDDDDDDEEEEEEEKEEKPSKKSSTKKAQAKNSSPKKGRGRPRKVKKEGSDDEAEKTPEKKTVAREQRSARRAQLKGEDDDQEEAQSEEDEEEKVEEKTEEKPEKKKRGRKPKVPLPGESTTKKVKTEQASEASPKKHVVVDDKPSVSKSTKNKASVSRLSHLDVKDDQGHFDKGDVASSVVYTKRDGDNVLFDVTWKPRSDGTTPANTRMTNVALRTYDKDVLLDFYEARLKFVKQNDTSHNARGSHSGDQSHNNEAIHLETHDDHSDNLSRGNRSKTSKTGLLSKTAMDLEDDDVQIVSAANATNKLGTDSIEVTRIVETTADNGILNSTITTIEAKVFPFGDDSIRATQGSVAASDNVNRQDAQDVQLESPKDATSDIQSGGDL